MSKYRRKLMMAYAANIGRGDIVYPGLIAAWSAKGKSNDDADRATLRDLTGNGHDITLNGFAFSGMSGYGGYNWSFNNFSRNTWEHTDNKIILDYNNKPSVLSNVFENSFTPSNKIMGAKIKVSGIKNGSFFTLYNHLNTEKQSGIKVNKILIKQDGIYSIQDIIISAEDGKPTASYYGFNGINIKEGDVITIELLPEYPDALVFDGVDDYGYCNKVENNSIKTIITKFQTIGYGTYPYNFVFSARNANVQNNITLENKTGVAYYARNDGDTYINGILNKTLKSQDLLNIPHIVTLTSKLGNTSSRIAIGCDNINFGNFNANIALYSMFCFDRILSEDEIKEFTKNYIDSTPIPDCYYDFSQGSNDDETRDTIKDLSGNGNNAVAHNFAWSGMSGYGGYGTDFTTWIYDQTNINVMISGNTATISKKEEVLSFPNFRLTDVGKIHFKYKVNRDCNLTYRYHKKDVDEWEINNIAVKANTESVFDDTALNQELYSERWIYFSSFDLSDLIIELLPEYPGALVFDGVDDYVSLDAFDSGFKTIFMVCRNFKLNKMLYDHRTTGVNFAIYAENAAIAYNTRNLNGTFINNVRNNTLTCNDLSRLKHLIHVKADNNNESQKPILGANFSSNHFFCQYGTI